MRHVFAFLIHLLSPFIQFRSTPMPDSFYEGKDDLTAAMGFEENGVTTIAFRRSLESQEPSDHTIEENMMLIWSVGQTHGNYNHKPASGLEKGEASILDFYRYC